MHGRKLFIIGALILGAIWLGVWGAVRLSDGRKMTPEKINEFIAENAIEDLSGEGGTAGADRQEVIDTVVENLNKLSWEERQPYRQPGGAPEMDEFFRRLSRQEKLSFFEATMDTGFQKMMEGFNAMTPEERRRYVENALKDLAQSSGGEIDGGLERLGELDPELVDRMTEAGLKAYYESASAEAKLSLAPLMQEMQKQMQERRGRRRRGDSDRR